MSEEFDRGSNERGAGFWKMEGAIRSGSQRWGEGGMGLSWSS